MVLNAEYFTFKYYRIFIEIRFKITVIKVITSMLFQ